MPLRQRASLAVALLMVSTAALAGTPQKSGSEPLIRPSADSPAAAASRGIKNRGARRLISRRPIARAGFPAGMRAIGSRQIGRAVWYQLEGSRTASGERMDDSRATAAHRSLPLLSYARVTNLDNGRSVVVQINDRGPVSHRFIIDLSPRAAAEIGMIRSGVAKVAVQPLALDEPQPAQRIAAAQ
jgi:rare lipoprotein A